MQLGLVTYQWGAAWDLPTVIKNCEAAGFRGVELRSTHKHGVEPSLSEAQRAEVAKRFADSKVELVGLGSACEYQSPDPAILKKNIEETKAFIRLCHDIGAGGLKVRPNGLPKNVPVEKTIAQIGAALNEVAEYGEGYGVQIRVEIHGHGTADAPTIKKIMDVASNSNAALCWNCNPEDTLGDGLKSNFNMLKNRFGRTVHIHDLNSKYPWRELFSLLKGIQYDGWTLLEEGAVPADPVQAMKAYKIQWEALASDDAIKK
jgi:sugar phosphate isomerase/epimerase